MTLKTRMPSALGVIAVALSMFLAGCQEGGSGTAATPSAAASTNAATNTPSSSTTNTSSNNTPVTTNTGAFTTGQDADLVVSALGFNQSGGALLFNHPGGIDSDGQRLVLADRRNNRVLIWHTAPTANTPPDLVLGQPDFGSNDPGTGRNNLNWPTAVSTAGGKLVVADANNKRLLIWSSFPTHNAQAADLVIQRRTLGWSWGVWTDGSKLVATGIDNGGYVHTWNRFPTRDHQVEDLLITGQGTLGTPRGIVCNGTSLITGDHNPRLNTAGHTQGSHVWQRLPTSDTAADFFLQDPQDPQFAWLQGEWAGNQLLLLGRTLHIWNGVPSSATTHPALSIDGFQFTGGDGADIAVAGSRVYISESNGNKVLVYNSVPTSRNQAPDFAIGAPDIYTNTLQTHGFIQNPVPATDGNTLVVTSDYDRKLFVWSPAPTQSGTPPSSSVSLNEPMWDNAIYGSTFVAGGRRSVMIWDSVPTTARQPDREFRDTIGSVSFRNIEGVALDSRYFFVADGDADAIYVWEGLPVTGTENPKYTLQVQKPTRLSSDGTYLAVVSTQNHSAFVFELASIAQQRHTPINLPQQSGSYVNLPQGMIVAHGHLILANSGLSQVFVWGSVADALAGRAANALLGEADTTNHVPEIGRAKLFSPAGLAYDGTNLWVGEFKFSGRLVRFSGR